MLPTRSWFSLIRNQHSISLRSDESDIVQLSQLLADGTSPDHLLSTATKSTLLQHLVSNPAYNSQLRLRIISMLIDAGISEDARRAALRTALLCGSPEGKTASESPARLYLSPSDNVSIFLENMTSIGVGTDAPISATHLAEILEVLDGGPGTVDALIDAAEPDAEMGLDERLHIAAHGLMSPVNHRGRHDIAAQRLHQALQHPDDHAHADIHHPNPNPNVEHAHAPVVSRPKLPEDEALSALLLTCLRRTQSSVATLSPDARVHTTAAAYLASHPLVNVDYKSKKTLYSSFQRGILAEKLTPTAVLGRLIAKSNEILQVIPLEGGLFTSLLPIQIAVLTGSAPAIRLLALKTIQLCSKPDCDHTIASSMLQKYPLPSLWAFRARHRCPRVDNTEQLLSVLREVLFVINTTQSYFTNIHNNNTCTNQPDNPINAWTIIRGQQYRAMDVALATGLIPAAEVLLEHRSWGERGGYGDGGGNRDDNNDDGGDEDDDDDRGVNREVHYQNTRLSEIDWHGSGVPPWIGAMWLSGDAVCVAGVLWGVQKAKDAGALNKLGVLSAVTALGDGEVARAVLKAGGSLDILDYGELRLNNSSSGGIMDIGDCLSGFFDGDWPMYGDDGGLGSISRDRWPNWALEAGAIDSGIIGLLLRSCAEEKGDTELLLGVVRRLPLEWEEDGGGGAVGGCVAGICHKNSKWDSLLLLCTHRIANTAAMAYAPRAHHLRAERTLHGLLVHLLLCRRRGRAVGGGGGGGGKKKDWSMFNTLYSGSEGSMMSSSMIYSDDITGTVRGGLHAISRAFGRLLTSAFPADHARSLNALVWACPAVVRAWDAQHPEMTAIGVVLRSSSMLDALGARPHVLSLLRSLLAAGADIPLCEARQGRCCSILMDLVVGVGGGEVVRWLLSWLADAEVLYTDSVQSQEHTSESDMNKLSYTRVDVDDRRPTLCVPGIITCSPSRADAEAMAEHVRRGTRRHCVHNTQSAVSKLTRGRSVGGGGESASDGAGATASTVSAASDSLECSCDFAEAVRGAWCGHCRERQRRGLALAAARTWRALMVGGGEGTCCRCGGGVGVKEEERDE